MQIREIKKDKKHCNKVTLDDNREFLIDKNVCCEYPLKADMELSEEELSKVLSRSDFVRAKERALWYLDRADSSEKAMFDKLKKAGFNPKSCAEVLAWLKEYGMIDDVRYATNFAERAAQMNISKRETYQKLLLKGISRELARSVTEETQFDESSQIRALIDKKYKKYLTDKKGVEKVFAALARKGFSFGEVRNELKRYSEEMQYAEWVE